MVGNGGSQESSPRRRRASRIGEELYRKWITRISGSRESRSGHRSRFGVHASRSIAYFPAPTPNRCSRGGRKDARAPFEIGKLGNTMDQRPRRTVGSPNPLGRARRGRGC